MGVRLRAEFEGGEWGRALARIAGAISLERAAEVAGEELRRDFAEQFGAGGDPKWAPLTPGTVRAKRSRGYLRENRRGEAPDALMQEGFFGPQNALMETGALRASWTEADGAGHIERVEGDALVIGSDLEYAATHQYGRPGGGWRGSDIPARPLRIREAAVRRITERLLAEAAGE